MRTLGIISGLFLAAAFIGFLFSNIPLPIAILIGFCLSLAATRLIR